MTATRVLVLVLLAVTQCSALSQSRSGNNAASKDMANLRQRLLGREGKFTPTRTPSSPLSSPASKSQSCDI
eukprot:CAMPEP_0205927128 /NCGR_PEP_ID=MMETSP1325-20131115/21981_1 /ASSEMBLY_ACC=CAM_ASM_000708 /TAXON_ID=236786 /ORGANISM="Florenciella sp., Strain RCC1007" /LENGTH=70 /DNA_ID=CAMNT_0053295957 /DNA_START=26 /DNA_END=235 /DNA_ORIENTATION=+